MPITEDTPAGPGQLSSAAIGTGAATATVIDGERRVVAVEDQVIEVVQETARIEKRVVEQVTNVRITASEHDEAVQAMLMHQDVVVDRVPVGTRIDAVPPVRREGDVVIVPVMEEVLVVEKRLVLKEELHIRIDVTTREETRTVRLRREHAEIDRDGTALPESGP